MSELAEAPNWVEALEGAVGVGPRCLCRLLKKHLLPREKQGLEPGSDPALKGAGHG